MLLLSNKKRGEELFGKNVLKISVILNILLLIFAGIVFYEKGGANEIKNPIPSNYQHRFDLFSKLQPSTGNIVFLGDSITQYAEWNELFSNEKIVNRGIGGDTTEGIINRLDQVVQISPSKVFIMIGINDLNKGISVKNVETNYEIILNRLQKADNTKIYVQSVLPTNSFMTGKNSEDKIVELNKRIALLAEKYNVKYLKGGTRKNIFTFIFRFGFNIIKSLIIFLQFLFYPDRAMFRVANR